MSFSAQLLKNVRKRMVLLCAIVSVFAAIVPFLRATFRVEIDYNEGWNIYNAAAVTQHQLLYPAAYAWTSVNYPMVSFWVLAQLHRITHDYLYTARALSIFSLIACSLIVAMTVRTLHGSRRSATLAGLFCFALFCANANQYIGMDDPQIFSLAFFCLGLLVHMHNRRSYLSLTAAVVLFVVGGSIKHNLLEFPLTVLVDIAIVSKRPSLAHALYFSVIGLLGVTATILLNEHIGGPHFLGALLAPRHYSFVHLLDQLLFAVGPALLPFLAAAFTAWSLRKDPSRAIASVLFVTAMVIGTGFSGGSGVSINAFFGVFVAIAVLLGLFFSHLEAALFANKPLHFPGLAPFMPLTLFLWLSIPLIVSGNWNPIAALHRVAAAQRHFDEDVTFLRAHPGAALCESLLECNFAAKPYLYDPFNATRLIQMHKLDPNILIEAIQTHQFSVIQTDDPLPVEDQYGSERWDAAVRAAIEANYIPALYRNAAHRDDVLTSVIYLPLPGPR